MREAERRLARAKGSSGGGAAGGVEVVEVVEMVEEVEVVEGKHRRHLVCSRRNKQNATRHGIHRPLDAARIIRFAGIAREVGNRSVPQLRCRCGTRRK